ncbi:hypothetical protein [Moumouvirus maliensis]|nr:hypothetical protein [Moumouvirus maliensis]
MSRDYDNTDQDQNIKCRSGEILRKGYHRKGFERREFVRSNGTIVPASYIPETYVPPTCVKDMGQPGKGPKILPTPRGDIHFRDYGYDVHKPDRERQQALIDASNDYNPLTVLRRMNLIRNYQPVPENKERMSRDVEFLSNYYAKIKEMDSNNDKNSRPNNRSRRSGNNRSKRSKSNRSNSRSKRSNNRSRSRSKKNRSNQRGGVDNETLDKNINNTLYSQSKNCENDKCSVINRVREQHIVDGRKIVYYTVDENDANEILNLDKMYLDSDRTIDQVVKDINKYKGFIIGIKVDEILQGYCQYKEIDNNKVKIVWFCANKGFGTPLYIFMEKYFQLNNYDHVILAVSLEDKYSTRRLNFWYKMGFRSNGISDKKQITMEKNI